MTSDRTLKPKFQEITMDTINASTTLTAVNELSTGTGNRKLTLEDIVRLGEQFLVISAGALTLAAFLM